MALAASEAASVAINNDPNESKKRDRIEDFKHNHNILESDQRNSSLKTFDEEVRECLPSQDSRLTRSGEVFPEQDKTRRHISKYSPSEAEVLDCNGLKRKLSAVDYWYERLNLLIEYRNKFGNFDAPQKYSTKSGVKLGAWVNKQRVSKKTFA